MCVFVKLVTAGEDVLVFYNDRASFQSLVQMMRLERERLDESSALRYGDETGQTQSLVCTILQYRLLLYQFNVENCTESCKYEVCYICEYRCSASDFLLNAPFSHFVQNRIIAVQFVCKCGTKNC